MPSNRLKLLSVLAISTLGFVSSSAAAIAVPETNGIQLFFSAPFVQGPSYSGAGFALEDFEGYSAAEATGCLGPSAVGTISNFCSSRPGDGAGGAITSTDTPTVNGSPSRYAAVPWASNEHIDIEFDNPVQYIGLWWSAGNVASGGGITNYVEFYSGDDLLTTMTADQVMEVLGGSVPNPYPGTETLTSEGGGTHIIGYYYGDPTEHVSLTPTSKSTATGDYPFVYLNLFTRGATRVDRIVIGGWGFEFDNLAVSTEEQTPTSSMVFVQEYLDTVTPPEEENNSGGGDGSGESGTDGDTNGTSELASTGFDTLQALILAGGVILFGATLVAVRRVRRI